MSLILTEEQTMLRQLRDARDAHGYSRPLWKQFGEMGFTGVLVPEAFGGLGLGHVEAGVVMEQIGHQLASSPFLSSSTTAVCALRHSGSKAQRPAQTALSANATGPGYTAGITLFLVEPTTPGVTIERSVMVDAHNARPTRFKDLKVDAGAVLGPVNGGWQTLCAADPKNTCTSLVAAVEEVESVRRL